MGHWICGLKLGLVGNKWSFSFRLLSHNTHCQWPNDPRITCKSISPAPIGTKEWWTVVLIDGHLVCGDRGVLDLWPRLGAKTGEFLRLLSHNPPCQWPNDPRITCKSISPAPIGSKEWWTVVLRRSSGPWHYGVLDLWPKIGVGGETNGSFDFWATILPANGQITQE
jgi:hypothetical protein